MSLALQSGFTWPSEAFNASMPMVSAAPSAISSSTMTAIIQQPPMSTPSVSTLSCDNQTTGVVSANSSIAALFSGTEPLCQRTTHVTITATVTATPVAVVKVQNFTVSVIEAIHETSSDLVIRSTAKSVAPDATGVVFKLYRPDSENPVPSSNEANSTKNKVILGAIIGPICLVVVILMLIAMWRGRGRTYGKHSKAEEGKYHRREQRSTNDMIDESHRRRRERNRRGREQDIELSKVTHVDVTDTEVSPVGNHIVRAHVSDGRGYDVSPLSSPTGLWGHVQHR